MGDVLTDRWAFTSEELENPSGCSADDVFRAEVMSDEEGGDAEYVLVNRRGEPLKVHGNGTYSVVIEMRDDLILDVLIKDDDSVSYLADTWRNVVVNGSGKFISFAED